MQLLVSQPVTPQEQQTITIWMLLKILRELELLRMGQADINTDQQAILTAVTNLNSAEQKIAAELQALKNQGVDTSGLDSAVASLGQAVQGIQALAPAPASSTGTSTASSSGTGSQAS